MEVVITAVVVVAIALPFVAALLGARLFDRLTRRRLVQPVLGTVTVTAVSNPTQDGLVPNPLDLLPSNEGFVLEGVAHVAGMAPYAVRVTDTAWTHRWPKVGDTLRVEVDRRDPSRVRILGDQVPD